MCASEVHIPLKDLKIVRFEDDPNLFYVPERHFGPSPYAHSSEAGPSSVNWKEPLRSSGLLDQTYKYTELTPGLGREYWNARLSDVLQDDHLLRDLAVTIAERGVVFFKYQADMTLEQQKKLADDLGRLSGRPDSAGLHIHPTALLHGAINPGTGKVDPNVWPIDSNRNAKAYKSVKGATTGTSGAGGYHSDITFEPVTASYAVLRLTETPSSHPSSEKLETTGGGAIGGAGGDTLWASGYALAEKVSPSFLAYLETLTGEYSQPTFAKLIEKNSTPFYSAPRGAPENVGDQLIATHPLVRTNPVTGWKSIFAIGQHFTKVNDVTPEESDIIKSYLEDLLYKSPEIQLRYKWSQYDVAIWDNRSVYHSIIHDISTSDGGVLNRTGLRTLSLGERPFLDPSSKLRSEALK